MSDPFDVEADVTDRAEQEAPVDPTEDPTGPVGGPGDAAEADWIDQNTDAPQDDEAPEDKY